MAVTLRMSAGPTAISVRCSARLHVRGGGSKTALSAPAPGASLLDLSALRGILVQHPEVIAQKARVIVEHFRAHTSKKLCGLAKAMVVTDSRAAAVKYKQAIDAYITQQGYDMATLVAFSGKVFDETAGEVTESSMR